MVKDQPRDAISRGEGVEVARFAVPDGTSSQLPVTGSEVTGNWESRRQARIVLRVTRTADDGTAEEATAVELPDGDVIVGVDGVEQPQRHPSLEEAMRAELVLHLVDDRRTAFWSPVLPSWELIELLEGDVDMVNINGATWLEEEEFGWWFENAEDDPNYEDGIAVAIWKVPGIGGMTGGPMGGATLQRLGNRYWFDDYERDIHERTLASTPLEGVEWFSGQLAGKTINFSSPLLDGLDDDAIAELLPWTGPALWVRDELWQRTGDRWRRRTPASPAAVGDVAVEAVDVCHHLGPSSGDYRWLRLDLTPADPPPDIEPVWWWVVIADPAVDDEEIEFLADAEYGSTENEVPEYPPAVIAVRPEGSRWYGVSTFHRSVGDKLYVVTPNALRFAGSPAGIWLLDGDGDVAQAWTYEATERDDSPAEADRYREVDVTW